MGSITNFFELVRQLELLSGMSEEAIEYYIKHCQELSNKVKDYYRSYDGGKFAKQL